MMTDPIKTQIAVAQEELSQIEEDIDYIDAVQEFYPKAEEMTDKQLNAMNIIIMRHEKMKYKLLERRQILLDFIKFATIGEDVTNDG